MPATTRTLPLWRPPPTATATALGFEDGMREPTVRDLLDLLDIAEDEGSHTISGYAAGLRQALKERMP